MQPLVLQICLGQVLRAQNRFGRWHHNCDGCNTKANILAEYKVINNFWQIFKLFGIYTNK
jgi:hypothetical protein